MIKTSALLSLFILGSLLIRLNHIESQSLTQNELMTLCRVNGIDANMTPELTLNVALDSSFTQQDLREYRTFNNVVSATIADSGNAAAYNVMLFWWTGIFGDSNFSIRALSVLFGVLTVILGYYFCRQLFNERTANIAAALLTFHPVLVEYGQLARAYVPAAFMILLATYSIYQVSVAKRHTWLHIPLYVLALNLALLSHYVTLYVFLSHVFLVAIFHSHRKALIQYGIMAVVGFGLFSVWLFNGGWQGKKPMNIERQMWQLNLPVNGEMPEHVSTAGDLISDTASNYLTIFGVHVDDPSLMVLQVLLFAIPVTALFFVFRKVRKSEYFRPVMFVTFPLGLYLIFILLMALRSGHSIPFDIRYAIFVIPFACLLLAFGIDRMMEYNRSARAVGYALMGILSAVMIASLYPALANQYDRQDINYNTYREAASFAQRSAADNDTLVFNDRNEAILVNLYLRKSAPWQQVIRPDAEAPMLKIHHQDMVAPFFPKEQP
ncbi:MAG: glycosyltransferase family 39 protein [Flavobacteriales bacterium]